jgi:hypothetical protein
MISPGCSTPSSAKAGALSVKRAISGVISSRAVTVAMPVQSGKARIAVLVLTASNLRGVRAP